MDSRTRHTVARLFAAVFLGLTSLAAGSKASGPIDLDALDDLDGLVSVGYQSTAFNRRSGQLRTNVVVTNISDETLECPLVLVISSISAPGVSLANADGQASNDNPFIDLSARLGTDNVLSPGESATPLTLTFNNPSRARFTFDSTALGVVATSMLTLEPIGDRQVSLGSTLTIQLSTTGPDVGSLTFSVDPLPLPNNASFNAATGLFTFTPDDDQIGSINLTFAVAGGGQSDSQTITITVEPSQPGTETSLSGRLLDTNDFVQGIVRPVVGATVSLLGTGLSTTSDASGRFNLMGIPADNQIINIDSSTADAAPDGSPYAGFREEIEIIEGVPNVVDRPFFLPRIAGESLTQIDPTTTTLVDNPTLDVTLTVPPNTAKNPDGSNFTGQMSISQVPEGLAPAALPEELNPGMLVTIQPVGVTFATPAPITFPNVDNLTPGSEVDIWSLDPQTGTFVIVGVGRVTDDGLSIVTISGGIRAADWHAPLPPGPDPDNDDNNEDNEDPDKECEGETGSSTSVLTGNLTVNHTLPGYQSQGRTRNLRLVYRSLCAAPRPVITSNVTVSQRAAVPLTVSTRLDVAGVDQGTELFTDTSGLNESVDETIRQAVGFDASGMATGLYRYRLSLTSNYSSSSISGGQGGRVIVNNQIDSPFGAGWQLTGLSKLHVTDGGRVLITDGDGSAVVFRPAPLDLNTWSRQGNPANGNWIVSADGTSVLQTVNGSPTFFVGPDDLIDTTIRGTFRVETAEDDDFIGFVIGFKRPAGNENTFDFILLDWKQAIQDVNGFVADAGFTLSRVSGDISDPFTDYWNHTHPAVEVLASDLGATKGWFDNTDHDFELIYETNRIRIAIDGDTVFDIPGSFEPGKFGFYNLSQEQVRYRGFSSTSFFESPTGDFSNLVKNDDDTFTRTLKDGTEIHFNADGLHTSTEDRHGNTTTYAYDNGGLLTSITDPVGLVTTFTYSDGLLSSVTDPAGRVTTFDHDDDHNLVRITDPDGSSREFGYNSSHLLNSQTSKRGFVTQYEYNPSGQHVKSTLPDSSTRLIEPVRSIGLIAAGDGTKDNPAPVVRPDDVVGSLTDGNGESNEFALDRFGQPNQFTDAVGRGPVITRDDDGQPVRIVQPTGRVDVITYDDNGNTTSYTEDQGTAAQSQDRYAYLPSTNLPSEITLLSGQVVRIEYTPENRPTRIITPDGSSRSITYDTASNLPMTFTDEIGATTTVSYDPSGRIAEIVDPMGVRRQRQRDAAGNVTQDTTAVGTGVERIRRFTYDNQNRRLTFTDGAGGVTRFRYDDNGNRVETEDPTGRIVRREFDSLNRVASTIDPIRGLQSNTYDAQGNITEQVDALGNATRFEYDEAGQIVATIDAEGGRSSFGYDSLANINRVVDACGNEHEFVYDSLGHLSRRTDSLGMTTSYTYDAAGRVTTQTNPTGDTIRFFYDIKGRLLRVETPDNTLSYTYNARGNLTEVTDDDSTVNLTYDGRQRMTSSTTSGTGMPTRNSNVFL